MKKFSLNNRFIVEPYFSDRSIKMTNSGGFAMIQQKVSLVPLKILVDVHLFDKSNGNSFTIPAGSKAYIKEELLHTQEWAKRHYECSAVEGKFMIVEPAFIEIISPE